MKTKRILLVALIAIVLTFVGATTPARGQWGSVKVYGRPGESNLVMYVKGKLVDTGISYAELAALLPPSGVVVPAGTLHTASSEPFLTASGEYFITAD